MVQGQLQGCKWIFGTLKWCHLCGPHRICFPGELVYWGFFQRHSSIDWLPQSIHVTWPSTRLALIYSMLEQVPQRRLTLGSFLKIESQNSLHWRESRMKNAKNANIFYFSFSMKYSDPEYFIENSQYFLWKYLDPEPQVGPYCPVKTLRPWALGGVLLSFSWRGFPPGWQGVCSC